MGRGAQNWWVYMIIFFVAQTAVSTIGFGAATLLGFPAGWITILSLPITGAVLYLYYKGYPLTAYAMLGCILVILICVFGLLRAVTIQKPHAPSPEIERLVEDNNKGKDFVALLLGQASYDDFLSAYGDFDYTLETSKDSFLLSYNDYEAASRTQLTIQFPELDTLDGLWAFQEGSVHLRGAYSATFSGLPAENWVSSTETSFEPATDAVMQPASPQPYLVVSIPLRENLGDKAMLMEATLNITYPAADGTVAQKTLTRQLSVYIASTAYYVYRDEYNAWQRSRRLVETPLWLGLVGVSIAAVVASVVLVKRGALQATGGFVMVVKRASGVKQLGVEAHPLSTLDVVLPQDIEGGVVLGVVNAQSPAGRSGLRSGDVVYMLDGKAIHSPKEFNRLTSHYKKGEQGHAHVWRDGQRVDVIITF